MKLHPEQPSALNTITAYGDGYIEINARRHEGAIRVAPHGEVQSWSVTDGSALSAAAVAELLVERPEIILLGTGERQLFPDPAILAELYRTGTGFEVMSTPAACRTYNILMAEGRRVLAALMPTR